MNLDAREAGQVRMECSAPRLILQGKQIKQTKLEVLKAGPEVVRAFVE